VLFCFSASQRKAKKKNQKLCDLCGSAVRIVLSKTLSGSPFKPPFLGVVVDYGFHQKIDACKLHGTFSNTSPARFITILENMFRFMTVFSAK